MSHRWMKFWPQDWRNDAGLRLCSAAARGVWIDLLAIMHECTPYGHAVVNGRPLTSDDIAGMINVNPRETARALDELTRRGVLSLRDDGAIFSRRMVRDNAHAEAGKMAVSRRWAKDGANTPPNTPPNRDFEQKHSSPPNSLEAEAESEADRVIPFGHNSRARRPRAASPLPNGFAEFWEHYPAKVGKQAALKAWPKAVRQAGGDPDEIVLALKARLHLFNPDFIPNPATWLNQGRWEDDPEALFARNQRSA